MPFHRPEGVCGWPGPAGGLGRGPCLPSGFPLGDVRGMAQGVLWVGFDDAGPVRVDRHERGVGGEGGGAHPAFGGRAAPGRLKDCDWDFQFLVQVAGEEVAGRGVCAGGRRGGSAPSALDVFGGGSGDRVLDLEETDLRIGGGGDLLLGVVGLADGPTHIGLA